MMQRELGVIVAEKLIAIHLQQDSFPCFFHIKPL